MSKRRQQVLLPAPQQESVLPPDDVLGLIFALLFGNPSLKQFDFEADDTLRLNTYFSLPLVCAAFNRVVARQRVDWLSIIETRPHRCSCASRPPKQKMTQEAARVMIYQKLALERLHAHIDAVVARESITYRSPVQRVLSQGKIAIGKLRHSKYPSATVRDEVLSAVRQYDRVCRLRRQMRVKYSVCI